jgi:putative ABC transport system permease protein
MNRFALILRNLRYFSGVNLALVLGMIVATAVLTGAIMVGDSVRQSLADLARQRLGKVDDALLARRFFDQSLAQRLGDDPQLKNRFTIAPGILLSGGASTANESVRAGDVQIAAAGGDFAPVAQGQCIINDPTAGALGLSQANATVLLSVPDKPDEPREAALSRRSREDTLSTLRSNVSQIHTAQDMLSLFNPTGGQRLPKNVWVNLPELQEQIELGGRVNTLLVHDNDAAAADTNQGAELLNRRLAGLVRLEDYGLTLATVNGGRAEPATASLTSRATYLDPPLVSAAESVAQSSHIPLQKVTVNLINSVRLEREDTTSSSAPVTTRPIDKRAGEGELHYAVAAGITPLDGKDLAQDEVAINQWTANELGAKVGDRLHLTFYNRQPGGDLMTVSSDAAGFKNGFRIVRILPMSGIGADRSLTPQYKGLTDADTIADWNPPEGVAIDKKLVTKADEAYWHTYRAAPKLFVSFAAAEKLWGGDFGNVTSLRVPASRADEFRLLLQGDPEHQETAALDPAAMGLAFQPIMARQLAASSGSTDFSGLFIGFSFFLIVAAALLVAMLFRLNIEQRARQMGLLSAVGFTPWGLRRLALGEGMGLATVGGLLGLPAAIAYTWIMMYGLRTWWNGAVGTTSLYLHVTMDALVYGLVASLFVAFLAILWAAWRVGKTAAATLLAGGWGAESSGRRSGRWLRVCGILLVLATLGIFAMAPYSHGDPQETFMGGGALLLCGCLCWLAGVLRPGIRRPLGAKGIATVGRLGIRNASRHTARSVLAVGLIAFAAFTLIAVAAFRQGAPENTGEPGSGAGGYRLIATAGIPLLGDLNTRQGRRILGMTDADDPLWDGVRFVSMRRWAGQDISCLNLTRPTMPTILSVPPELWKTADARGFRFHFAQKPTGVDNPWPLLDKPLDNGDIPVIADDATAQYILHLNPGQTIDVADAAGAARHLRLVATLGNSIFQSELLMSDTNFRRLFPTQEGSGVVLIDAPSARASDVLKALNTQLGEYAVDTEPTAYRLARYMSIQNTYLSTFQALGALGLMLGTIGLGVVLVRTVIERKAELALLASLGFAQGERVWLVLSENLFLLILGLGVGTVCAVLGILPAIHQSTHGINYGWLGLTMICVLIIGALSASAAVWFTGAHVTPADLRRE